MLMRDARSVLFVIGVVCVVGAVVTRFIVRDVPTVPRPATFLDFANTCFLLVICLLLVEILEATRKHFAAARKAAKAELDQAAEAETEEPAEEG